MNASSRFLASSQIVQNVKAIEDMRELLLQEHSLTIKVCLRCSVGPCSAAECCQPTACIRSNPLYRVMQFTITAWHRVLDPFQAARLLVQVHRNLYGTDVSALSTAYQPPWCSVIS